MRLGCKAGLLVAAAASSLAQPPPVEVLRTGLLRTTTGREVGYPSRVLLAWPRSEVHKHFGMPTRTLHAESLEPLAQRLSFIVEHDVIDVYEDRRDLSPNPFWVYYTRDPTSTRSGINQRVFRFKTVLAQPQSLWVLLAAAEMLLPEAAELCEGHCSLRKTCPTPASCMVRATPRPGTQDYEEIAALVASGYRSGEAEPTLTVVAEFRLAPDSWTVTEAHFSVAPVIPGQSPGASLGVWNPAN